MKYYVPLLVFAVLAAFLSAGLFLNHSLLPSPLVGKAVPRFTLATLEMPEKQLDESIFLGKVSLLNVWASWCRACIEEHPVLLRLAAQNDIPIYGLNYKDTREKAREWLAKRGNPYSLNFFDQEGRVAIDWGVYGVPETFLVDAQGKIHYKHVGILQFETIREQLSALKGEVAPDVH